MRLNRVRSQLLFEHRFDRRRNEREGKPHLPMSFQRQTVQRGSRVSPGTQRIDDQYNDQGRDRRQ